MSQKSFVDQLFSALDNGLRTTFANPGGKRVSPAHIHDQDPISDNPELMNKSAALMRVNHVGEVCAQALYQGQALTSRSDEVRVKMQSAADEEIDHLDWCNERIEQLNGHTSYFNPIWYLGSFALGVGAGLAGDKWSLGFLAGTERQVVGHLNSHLERLPEEDTVSRTVVTQMIEEEEKHAAMAIENGAAELPRAAKNLMRATARIMTSISERI
jgi:ubiquinone biosynthesis monooxygenase Coq7